MARIGINPARKKFTLYRPTRVTLAVLTYIPHLEGYFAGKFDVLKLLFTSLHAHTTPRADLLVFDNGSCQTVRDYLNGLAASGEIDYLLLSHQNIGKIGAFNLIFNSAPGEVIAYCDDDILFYPGWLEAHLAILDHFPAVGMVSGVPVRNAAGHARSSLERVAKSPPPGLQVRYERAIPDEWEHDWAVSTGRDSQSHLQATQDQQDMILTMNTPTGKIEAVGAANHFQFVARKEVLLKALPAEWTGRLMGAMVEFDEEIDRMGLLRLSTTQRFTRHMGNALSPDLEEDIRQIGLSLPQSSTGKGSQTAGKEAARKHWLLRIRGSRRVLSWLYNRLFDILYR